MSGRALIQISAKVNETFLSSPQSQFGEFIESEALSERESDGDEITGQPGRIVQAGGSGGSGGGEDERAGGGVGERPAPGSPVQIDPFDEWSENAFQ